LGARSFDSAVTSPTLFSTASGVFGLAAGPAGGFRSRGLFE